MLAVKVGGQLAEFSVLTVCSGNICRSPIAEQILRARLTGVPGLDFSSAGTYAGEGDMMPEEAVVISARNGGDPSAHRARYINEAIVDGADLILAMSRSHRREVVELVPRKVRVTFTLREFGRLAAMLSDQEIVAAGSRGQSARASAAEVVALVAAQKGQLLPLESPDDDDVIDPYRRSVEYYDLAESQMLPAIDHAARLFNLAIISQT